MRFGFAALDMYIYVALKPNKIRVVYRGQVTSFAQLQIVGAYKKQLLGKDCAWWQTGV